MRPLRILEGLHSAAGRWVGQSRRELDFARASFDQSTIEFKHLREAFKTGLTHHMYSTIREEALSSSRVGLHILITTGSTNSLHPVGRFCALIGSRLKRETRRRSGLA
jgi:hypothetical protein